MKLIKCNNCGKKVPKEVVSIECPDCYIKGFDFERNKIVNKLKKVMKKRFSMKDKYIQELIELLS